jgi:hemolysin D
VKNQDYHDFKPIVTEIEERPPNPLGVFFLWTVIALMVVIILGLYFVKVDVVITARGKIVPLGDIKVMQPLDTGVVTGINVKEGDYVKKGAVILEIDTSVDIADLEGKERNLSSSMLAMERIHAVLYNKEFLPSGRGMPRETVHAQITQYNAQKNVYTSTLQEKEKEYQENQSVISMLKKEIGNINSLLGVVREDEKRQKALVDIGALSDNRYRDKMKERMNLEKELEVKLSQKEQAETKLLRVRDEMETFRNTFREKLLSEFNTNMLTRNILEAEVSSIRFKQGKKFIVSPVDGFVHLLPVKTIGGVVTTAQPVVSLVPENTPLAVNAIILNKDIGFVKEGQRCVIKVDTFDFQKYGTIEAAVETINPYSLEETGKEKEKNAETQGYPVRFKMFGDSLKTSDGTVYPVKPGMSVTAEINVGKRRLIEFFLFPVIKYLDEGLKVR